MQDSKIPDAQRHFCGQMDKQGVILFAQALGRLVGSALARKQTSADAARPVRSTSRRADDTPTGSAGPLA